LIELDKFPDLSSEFVNLLIDKLGTILSVHYDETGWIRGWRVSIETLIKTKFIEEAGGVAESKTETEILKDIIFWITTDPTSLQLEDAIIGGVDYQDLEIVPIEDVQYPLPNEEEVIQIFGPGPVVILNGRKTGISYSTTSGLNYIVHFKSALIRETDPISEVQPDCFFGSSVLKGIENDRRIAVTTLEFAKFKKAVFGTIDFIIDPSFIPRKSVSFFEDPEYGLGNLLVVNSEEIRERILESIKDLKVEIYKEMQVIDPNILFPDAFSFTGEVFPLASLDEEAVAPLSELEILSITDFKRDDPYLFIGANGKLVLIQNLFRPKSAKTVVDYWEINRINLGFDAEEDDEFPTSAPLFESDLDDLKNVSSDWVVNREGRVAVILKL
jgi:hypothetical protein